MNKLRTQIETCTACPLHKDMPFGNCPVPGIGPSNADIMLVGEALGKDESETGEPFVGLCGQFLDKMLNEAGLDRKDMYITNTVKCRPKKGNANRAPTSEEIAACKPHLWREMQAVKPRRIVTLGKVPTYTLLHSRIPKGFILKNVLGRVYHIYYGDFYVEVMPLYHPSYLMQHGKDNIEKVHKLWCKLKKDMEK